MAVMITDIILLDIFNSLGMPTSTTVSMVFELLGAAFVITLIKLASADLGLGFDDFLNTEKALSVILGIFLSVAIAFFFGIVVQWISRLIFSFNYKRNLKWFIGIFGGISTTAIIYFMLIKGVKDLSFMTPEVKQYIHDHTLVILGICFTCMTLLMQLLHICKVNVLKIIVLFGTFSLAVAFAGNDLVNFIGVPITGLDSYRDYIINGNGDAHSFMMGSLNSSAKTPIWFLIGAGVIMVIALVTSKKAQNVSKTEIGLGAQGDGEELFGSSRIARSLVRWVISFLGWIDRVTPPALRRKVMTRFNVSESIMAEGASFDLIRASINLVLAGTLIALGTSLKLPLSTTFVTFMVAMGSSLADRAWSRESAVFRITGVISVIGGWFITAGVAFIGAGIIVLMMYYGGHWAMIALGIVTIFIIIRSNKRFKNRQKEEENGDTLFNAILTAESNSKLWPLVTEYISSEHNRFISFANEAYSTATQAFVNDDMNKLAKTELSLRKEKDLLKAARRKATLCLRRIPREQGMEKSAWFHLANNSCMSILYNLVRITETCREHVSNNFRRLPEEQCQQFANIHDKVQKVFANVSNIVTTHQIDEATSIRRDCDIIKNELSLAYHKLYEQIRIGDAATLSVMYVYLNVLQETNELISSLRKYVRAYAKLYDTDYSGHKHSLSNSQ